VGVRIPSIEGYGLVQILQATLDLSYIDVQSPAIGKGIRILGVELDCKIVVGQSLVVFLSAGIE
jgi:hypothetical protein